MKVISDLHLHSKYSRAVSDQMVLPTIAEWAKKKGIRLVGTGDFTHPMWFREIKANLKEVTAGIYRLPTSGVNFVLTTELSCIYSDLGKGRRVHVLIFLPEIDDVEKFNNKLLKRGANLFSDGRPILGLSLREVTEISLEASSDALIIPAHAWTPWFGVYGGKSGYGSLDEAFGNVAKFIPAVETGLSSDPAMNWRMTELEERAIISFSDAHSPAKIGREATVFDLPQLDYESLKKLKVAQTIEFYPEEGKYHFTGHRNCGVVYSPEKVRQAGVICPVCGKVLTPGVMSRVESLGKGEVKTEVKKDKFGVRWIYSLDRKKPPYTTLVPLMEILAESYQVGVASQKVTDNYELVITNLGSEFEILLNTRLDAIRKVAGEKVAEAIGRVRGGDILIKPGYDGVFGRVKIWPDVFQLQSQLAETFQQENLFS